MPTVHSTPVVVEHIWISGANTHHDIRSKFRTFHVPAGTQFTIANIPEWNFDGSSTGQAIKSPDTEILIRPVALYPHPFIDDVEAYVALCECFLPSGVPTPDNTRHVAAKVFLHKEAEGMDPWFGMEQEHILMKGDRPLGWPESGEPKPQGPYYCSNGPSVAIGRKYVMEHYKKCLKMGLKISGVNAEVFPAQWEFQVGPCHGLEMGDQLTVARWCFLRVLEEEQDPTLDINFDVKPKKGDWNGSGLHTNFSTAATRKDGGLDVMLSMMANLSKTVHKDVVFYSQSNNERLTGKHETSSLDAFSYGYGTRGTSIRIPNQVKHEKKGYFEDRRPGADADPYLVSARLFASACNIPAPELDELDAVYRKPWMPTSSPAFKSAEAVQQQH
jgi:glutamine synthetase